MRALRLLLCLILPLITLPKRVSAQTDYLSQLPTYYSRLAYDMEMGASKTGTGRYLANRSVYALDPSRFDGTAASDTLQSASFRTLYDQLSRGADGLPTTAELIARSSAWRSSGQVALSLVYWNYDYLLPAAFNDQRMGLDAQGFYRPRNANGTLVNPASPYATKTLFGASVVQEGPTTPVRAGSPVSFVLPQNLVMVAPEASLLSLTVAFGDGSSARAMTVGTGVNVTYAIPGSKLVTVTAQVLDAGVPRTVVSRSLLYVAAALQPDPENPELHGFASDGATYCNSGSGLSQYDGCREAG